MHTPRMDELAQSGTLFQRAYVQYSLCGPSRQSFMTGRRPDATRAYSFKNHFREEGVGMPRRSSNFPADLVCCSRDATDHRRCR